PARSRSRCRPGWRPAGTSHTTRRCGRNWPRPGCCRWRCRRSWAGTASGPPRPGSCWPRPAGRARRSRCWPPAWPAARPAPRGAAGGRAGGSLGGAGGGGPVLPAALREPSQPRPAVPATVATLDVFGGSVTGVKLGVPYAAEADWVLVPARLAGGGTAVVGVSPAAGGVSTVRTPSSGGDPEYTLALAGVPLTGVLGGTAGGAAAGDTVTGLYELAVAGACCVADGALAAALALTTEHLATRQQFGRPLA